MAINTKDGSTGTAAGVTAAQGGQGGKKTNDWKATRASVNGHMDAVAEELALNEADDPTYDQPDKRFGKDVNDAAQAGADLMDDVSEAFGNLDFTGDDLREQEQEVRELRTNEAAIRQTADAVAAKANKAEIKLTVMTGQVLDTVRAIEMTPGPRKTPIQTKLDKSSGVFKGVIQGRNQARTTARNATLKSKDALNIKDEQVLAGQDEVATLELQNRYLQGDQLRPEDLIRTQPAAAPQKGGGRRKAGKTAKNPPATSGGQPGGIPGTPAPTGKGKRRTPRTMH